jgi:hypothetical protein
VAGSPWEGGEVEIRDQATAWVDLTVAPMGLVTMDLQRLLIVRWTVELWEWTG